MDCGYLGLVPITRSNLHTDKEKRAKGAFFVGIAAGLVPFSGCASRR